MNVYPNFAFILLMACFAHQGACAIIPQADCSTRCTNFTDVATLLWESDFNISRNGERYDIICGKYEETKKCVASIAHCNNPNHFETVSSGMKYMCENQRDAFEVLKYCIDAHLSSVYDICMSECRPDVILHGFVWNELLQQIFPIIKNLRTEMTMFTFNEGCRISSCLLRCMKSKYNDRCEGVLGSLLSEVMIRPFNQAYEKTGGATLWLQYLLPKQCSFIYDRNEMIEFLIPNSMDHDLQKIYTQKNLKRKKHLELLETDPEYGNKVLASIKNGVPVP